MQYIVTMPKGLADRLRKQVKPIISSTDPCEIGDIATSKDRTQVYKVVRESTVKEFKENGGRLSKEDIPEELFYYEVEALD